MLKYAIAENLFCTVATICNLVGEFNGLVSTKGSAKAGPLVFYDLPVFLVNCTVQSHCVFILPIITFSA